MTPAGRRHSRRLRELARTFNAAVLLVHHARKSGAAVPGQAARLRRLLGLGRFQPLSLRPAQPPATHRRASCCTPASASVAPAAGHRSPPRWPTPSGSSRAAGPPRTLRVPRRCTAPPPTAIAGRRSASTLTCERTGHRHSPIAPCAHHQARACRSLSLPPCALLKLGRITRTPHAALPAATTPNCTTPTSAIQPDPGIHPDRPRQHLTRNSRDRFLRLSP